MQNDIQPNAQQWGVFRSGGRLLSIVDVIDAAHFRGELEPYWKRLLILRDCEDTFELDEADEAAIQAESETFRQERDLITAEEAERWLVERGLTLDDFSGYLLRHYCARKVSAIARPETCESLSVTAELRELLRVELLISGDFDRMAIRLAWRCAALAESTHPDLGELIDRERQRLRERFAGAETDVILAQLGRDETWLDEMLMLEAAFSQQCEAALEPGAIESTLDLLRWRLTRFEIEVIELESREAAREALLCIREDDTAMHDVAKDCRYPYRRVSMVLEDLPAELQHKFICASRGECLEPLERSGGFLLYRLMRKIEPSLADTEVRTRVEQQIHTRHFSELAARYVEWLIVPSSNL